MKRRHSSQELSSGKRTRREVLLFDLLPQDVITHEIYPKLESPWRYLLEHLLTGHSDQNLIKKEAFEVVKYGLKITKYLVENNLLRTGKISQAACFHGNWEIYQYGISLGANDRLNESHLEYAILGGQVSMFKKLLNSGIAYKPISLIMKIADVDRPEFLTMIYEKTKYNRNHLLIACQNASINLIRYYIENFRAVPNSGEISRALQVGLPNDGYATIQKRRDFLTTMRDEFNVEIDQSVYSVIYDYRLFKLAYEFGLIPDQEQIVRSAGEPLFTNWLLDTFPLTLESKVAILKNIVWNHADMNLVKRLRDLGTPWSVLDSKLENLPGLRELGYPYVQESLNRARVTIDRPNYPILKKLNCRIPEYYKIHLLRNFNSILQAEDYLEMMHYTYEYLVIPLWSNDLRTLRALGNRLSAEDYDREMEIFIYKSLLHKKLVHPEINHKLSLTGIVWLDRQVARFNRALGDQLRIKIVELNPSDPSIIHNLLWYNYPSMMTTRLRWLATYWKLK